MNIDLIILNRNFWKDRLQYQWINNKISVYIFHKIPKEKIVDHLIHYNKKHQRKNCHLFEITARWHHGHVLLLLVDHKGLAGGRVVRWLDVSAPGVLLAPAAEHGGEGEGAPGPLPTQEAVRLISQVESERERSMIDFNKFLFNDLVILFKM